MTNPNPWRIIWIWPGHEGRAQKRLQYMDIEHRYYIEKIEKRVWRTRNTTRTVEVPAFPGYIFCRPTSLQERAEIAELHEVGGFLTYLESGDDCAVTPEEVERWDEQQKLWTFESGQSPATLFKVGEEVQVTGGPFSGFPGVVEAERKGTVRVTMETSGGAVTLDIKPVYLERAIDKSKKSNYLAA